MAELRTYGKAPFRVVLLHGGPGAPGEMAPVARELGKKRGVLEPLQTAPGIAAQLTELAGIIMQGRPPVAVVGWSWGAWLGTLFAARYPQLVRKLVLVSSPPFEEKYTVALMSVRLSRLRAAEQVEVRELLDKIDLAPGGEMGEVLRRFGALMALADTCDGLPRTEEGISCDYAAYRALWDEGSALRKSGELLEIAKGVQCPVVAIHGDYDAHPAAGVRDPLARVLRDFRFVLLPRCGHQPWYERGARKEFYDLLRRELS